LVQSIWGLLQLYDFLPSFNSNFKITGTFFNPAPYAMYLAVIFPLALGQIMKNEKLRLNKVVRTGHGIFSYIQYFWQFFILHSSFLIYYLSFATVIAILLVLPATMIRAAWLGALAGALIVLQFKYHYIQQVSQFLNTRFKKTVAMAVAAVIIASLGTGIFFLKKDSANGKLFIWEVTLGKIVEKPLFGYGVGRFEAEYNNWQAEYFQNHPEEMVGPKGWVAGNTKYCFNEFLEMASEIGGTGLLLFVCLLVLALGGVPKLKLRKLENEGIRKVEDPLILNSFIASFLFIFFFSFPFYNLPLLLAFFGILAVISSNKQAIAVSERTTFISRYSLATSLLFLVIWFAFELHQNQAVNEIWQKASNLYSANAYDIAEKEYEKAYTSCKYNNEFLQQYGKCLAMNKNFTKAQITLSEANKFGGDYMLFANLGDVYKELKQYPQAEIAYKYAACMIPHKLYPHYLLAKLYLQSGNKAKAVKKAKEILAMNVKVENGAVSEIEKEMKKIIAQFNKEL